MHLIIKESWRSSKQLRNHDGLAMNTVCVMILSAMEQYSESDDIWITKESELDTRDIITETQSVDGMTERILSDDCYPLKLTYALVVDPRLIIGI